MTTSAVLVLTLSVAATAGTAERDGDREVLCRVNGEPVLLKDLELQLYWDEHAQVAKEPLDFLIRERLVRQEVARKGISVKTSDVDDFLAGLDRDVRAANAKDSLASYLAAQGITSDYFRRQTETVIGLFYLAGGKEHPYQGMKDPAVKKKMNDAVADLAAAGKVETDPGKLEAGAAATVNGERISIEDAGHLARLSFSDELKRKHLGQLQLYVMVRQELQRRKLELAPEDLDFQFHLVASARATTFGEKELPIEDVLRSLGQDPRLLRRQYGFRAMAMLSRMVKDQVTDEELKKLFAADPARFGDGVPKASQILLKAVDAAGRPLSPDADLKVRARIEALRAKLVAGEDFAGLAGKVSEDKDGAEHGGNLGFLDKSRIADPVVAAAYGLKVGELSAPVRSAAGWHLVKVLEIKHVSFEEAKPLVRLAAIRSRRNQLLEDLKKGAKIEPGLAKL